MAPMKFSKKAKAVVNAFVKAVPPAAQPTLTKKVAQLTKQVKKLNTVSYDKITCLLQRQDAASVVTPVYQWHVNARMDLWTPIFGSTAADVTNLDKCYINSYKMDVRLTQDNEPDRIYYTMFIVSLKDQAADSTTFDPATGNLTLADGIHYQTLGTNGRTLVNQKFFNIHAYKRFTMGGRAGDQSAPETRDLSFTIVPKQKLIVNPRGNCLQNVSFQFPKDPSQNYYLLLFNDDAGADLQTNKIAIGGLASLAVPS